MGSRLIRGTSTRFCSARRDSACGQVQQTSAGGQVHHASACRVIPAVLCASASGPLHRASARGLVHRAEACVTRGASSSCVRRANAMVDYIVSAPTVKLQLCTHAKASSRVHRASTCRVVRGSSSPLCVSCQRLWLSFFFFFLKKRKRWRHEELEGKVTAPSQRATSALAQCRARRRIPIASSRCRQRQRRACDLRPRASSKRSCWVASSGPCTSMPVVPAGPNKCAFEKV